MSPWLWLAVLFIVLGPLDDVLLAVGLGALIGYFIHRHRKRRRARSKRQRK